MNRQSILTTLLLSALAAISLALRHGGQANAPALSRSVNQYDVRDARMEVADQQGKFFLQLSAQEMHQARQSSTLEFTEPRIEYQPHNGHWRTESRLGRFNTDQQTLDLADSVKLSQGTADTTSSTDTPGLSQIKHAYHMPQRQLDPVIYTDALHIDLDKQTAHTSSSVRLVVANGELHFNGLQADLRQQELQLESNLHGTFIH